MYVCVCVSLSSPLSPSFSFQQSTFLVHVGIDSNVPDANFRVGPNTPLGGSLSAFDGISAVPPAWTFANFYPSTIEIVQGDTVQFVFDSTRAMGVAFALVPATLVARDPTTLTLNPIATASGNPATFAGSATLSSGLLTQQKRRLVTGGSPTFNVTFTTAGTFNFVELAWGSALMNCTVSVLASGPATFTPVEVESAAQTLIASHQTASATAENTLGLSVGGVQGSRGPAHSAPSPITTNRNDGMQTWRMKTGDTSTLGAQRGVYQRFIPSELTIHMGDIVQFSSAASSTPAAVAAAFPAMQYLVLNGSSTDGIIDWPHDGTVHPASNPTELFVDTESAAGVFTSAYMTTYTPARSGASWYMGKGVMSSGAMGALGTTTLARTFSVQFALPGTYAVWSANHGGDVGFTGLITVLPSCATRQLPAVTGLIREYPTLTGMNNNLRWCVLGMPNFRQARLAVRSYYAGAATSSSTTMRTVTVAGDGRSLPTGRNVSNTMMAKRHKLSSRMVSDMHTSFAMLLTFDISALGASGGVTVPQPIPACDPYLDPCATGGTGGNVTLSFSRMVPLAGTGSNQLTDPTLYPNQLTSFLDASMIYGGMKEQTLPTAGVPVELGPQTGDTIRTFVGGLICLNCSIPGSVVPNNVGPWAPAGDSRTNKSPSVYAIALVFRREHNRLAKEFAIAHPDWSDEQLYQESRRWVVAFWQKIVTREYLATEAGQPLPAYRGYNSSEDAATLLEFSAGAGRYGHSMITPLLWRRSPHGEQVEQGDIPWATCLFRTDGVTLPDSGGIEPVLWGLIAQRQAAVGPRLDDAVRNMALFGSKKGLVPSNDLAVTNIARGKDIGIPTYNEMRRVLGLTPRTSFAEINPSDPTVAADLAMLYPTIEDIDMWVGGLAEEPRLGGNLGETFGAIALEQTRRWRDADRFWYENPDYFLPNETAIVYETTLIKLLARNTDMNGENGAYAELLPQNAFFTLGSDLAYQSRSQLPLALSTSGRYEQSVRLHPSYVLSWNVLATGYLDIELRVANNGWAGLGFEPQSVGTMKGADIVICRFLAGLTPTLTSGSTSLRTGSTGLTFECLDSIALDVGIPTPDSWAGGTDDLINVDAYVETDYTSSEAGRRVQVFRFQKPLTSNDVGIWVDKAVVPNGIASNIIFAFHPDSQAAVYHGPSRKRTSVNFFNTVSTGLTFTKDSETMQLALVIIMAAALVLPISVLVMVFIHRDHPRIRAATLLFCVFIPVGCICAFIGAIVALTPTKSIATCMTFFWLVATGFVLVYGSIFVKTYRIMRIFAVNNLGEKGKKSGKLVAVKITTTTLVGYLSGMLLAIWLLLALWTGLDPLTPRYTLVSGSDTHMYESCKSDSDGWLYAWLAMPVALLLAGSYMSYAVRGVDNAMFNEAASLAQSIYVTTVLAATALVFGFSLRGFPSTASLLQTVAVLAAFTFVLASQFAGKFSDIHDDQNASRLQTVAGGMGHTNLKSKLDNHSALPHDATNSDQDSSKPNEPQILLQAPSSRNSIKKPLPQVQMKYSSSTHPNTLGVGLDNHKEVSTNGRRPSINNGASDANRTAHTLSPPMSPNLTLPSPSQTAASAEAIPNLVVESVANTLNLTTPVEIFDKPEDLPGTILVHPESGGQ
jgi:plastocyanin